MATQDQTQVTEAAEAQQAEQKQPHGGLLLARRLKAHGVSKLFTLSGGHLFSIYDGCRDGGHRPGRRAPRVRGRVRGRGLGEGHPAARRRGPDGRPRGHERHERDRVGAQEQLADDGARGPRPPVPVGPGVAPGDRPRPVRRAAHEVRAHRDLHRRDRRPGRRGARGNADPAHGADLPRSAAGRRVHGGRRGGEHRRAAGPGSDAGRRRP